MILIFLSQPCLDLLHTEQGWFSRLCPAQKDSMSQAAFDSILSMLQKQDALHSTRLKGTPHG